MIRFTPSPIVAAILHALLDMYERRVHSAPDAQTAAAETPERALRALRVHLNLADFPLYYNQADPTPRASANEQLQTLAQSGHVSLAWLSGEQGHLLASVTLEPAAADAIFELLRRTPLAAKRGRLSELLLSEKFRYAGWRLRALQHTLAQLRAEKSPAPFSLSDDPFNADLLIALAALDGLHVETPQRVFSVRVFNDSKRFEDLASALATLARRHAPEWRELTNAEVLRELNLVANPSHIFLHGAWQLADADGLSVSLAGLSPSVGIAAAQAARTERVTVDAPQVIAVENPTSFYELIRTMADPTHNMQYGDSQSLAAICLMGNPSPACRYLLSRLPPDVPLLVWADIDYGGLNILAQIREQVNANAIAYRMDIETLEAHATFARPLTPGDIKNLGHLARRPSLADMRPLIARLLACGLKLEQEALRW